MDGVVQTGQAPLCGKREPRWTGMAPRGSGLIYRLLQGYWGRLSVFFPIDLLI